MHQTYHFQRMWLSDFSFLCKHRNACIEYSTGFSVGSTVGVRTGPQDSWFALDSCGWWHQRHKHPAHSSLPHSAPHGPAIISPQFHLAQSSQEIWVLNQSYDLGQSFIIHTTVSQLPVCARVLCYPQGWTEHSPCFKGLRLMRNSLSN